MDLNQTIPKYPYNGKAKNLIDKFMIIGYEPNLLRKVMPEIIEKNKSKQKTCYYSCGTELENFLKEIQLSENLDILSEITYDATKDLLPNNYIINSIFPEAPNTYIEIKCSETALQTNIIFSGDSIKENTKNSFNCYAYIFYEKFKYDSNHYCYPPKAFVFLSEYPFFTSFNQIATQIHKLISLPLDIPIELILYNLVKFTPSPIQYGFTLKLLNQDLPIDTLPTFEKLTGYPLFQFNLSVLFSILPTHIIMKMFLFTFLEVEILVFSTNLEILNLVLYIFIQLNYPLNVMHYYWQTGSTSLHNYLEGDSLFASKIYSSIQGIHCLYNSSINTTKNSHEHFIVDLEDKIFVHRFDEKYKKYARLSETNIALLKYIDHSISTASSINPKDSQLTNSIKTLYNDLEQIAKKIIHSNRSAYGFPNFFVDNEAIQQQNRNIQQIFYLYITKVISTLKTSNHFNETKNNIITESFQSNHSSFSNNNNLSNQNDYNFISHIPAITDRYAITYDDSKCSFTIEEKLFIDSLENSSKNVLFRDIANKSQMFIDLYQIGNIFFDELTNWSVLDNNKDKFNKSPFEAIDFIYQQEPKQAMTFGSFYSIYHQQWRKLLNVQFKETSIYKQSTMKQFCYNYSGRPFDLNYDVLRTYNHLLDNISQEELLVIFPMKQSLEENIFQEINQVSIQNSVTRNLIQQNELEKEDVIYISLLTVLSISLKYDFFPISNKQLCLIISSFPQCKVNKQKFITFILQVLYQRMNHKDRIKDKRTIFADMNLFDIIIRILFSNDIIPNEELLQLMNRCFAKKKSLETHFKAMDIENIIIPINDDLNNSQISTNEQKEENDVDDFELIDKNDEVQALLLDHQIESKAQSSTTIPSLREFNYQIINGTELKPLKQEKLLTTLNNLMFDGDWFLTRKKQTIIKLKYESKSIPIQSPYLSLRKIYNILTKMMVNDDNNNDMVEYKNVLVNLLFYITNLEKSREKEQIENFLGKLIYFLEHEEIEHCQGKESKIMTVWIDLI